jgi:hypothetical protein
VLDLTWVGWAAIAGANHRSQALFATEQIFIFLFQQLHILVFSSKKVLA